MSVTAKFRVTGIVLSPYGGWNGQPKTVSREVRMIPVQGEPFGSATPSGQLTMMICNPEAADQFEIEGEYLVTFEKITPGHLVTMLETGLVVTMSETEKPLTDKP